MLIWRRFSFHICKSHTRKDRLCGVFYLSSPQTWPYVIICRADVFLPPVCFVFVFFFLLNWQFEGCGIKRANYFFTKLRTFSAKRGNRVREIRDFRFRNGKHMYVNVNKYLVCCRWYLFWLSISLRLCVFPVRNIFFVKITKPFDQEGYV